MSQVTLSVDDRRAALPLPALVEALDALSVPFTRRGEGLALKNGGALTSELKAAVADHKPALLALCDLRAGAARLFEYGTRLRCQDPPKGARPQALRFQSQQIEKLAALATSAGLMIVGPDGEAAGYADPSDPWAEEALVMLREDLAELSREDAPYPVPLPAGRVLLPQANFDPFEARRNYAGKMLARCLVLICTGFC